MGILPKCFGFSDSEHTSSSTHANQFKTQIEELCHRFSLSQLRKSTNNFDKSQLIGRGYFSTVYKGCLHAATGTTDQTIAIKRMETTSSQRIPNKSDLDKEFKNEIELLCQIRHPNVISLIGFCNEKDEKILVYEYMPNGSLFDQLRREGKFSNIEPLSWKKRLQICIGAARGLHYLHTGVKRTIFHRDMKASNILLDQNWVPKLADFSLSLRGPHSMPAAKPTTGVHCTLAGTVGFIAPECYRESMFTDRSDVYSFGMVLLQVVSGKTLDVIVGMVDKSKLYSKSLASEVFDIVERGKGSEIIDPFLKGQIARECWKMFMDIADSCTVPDAADQRPTMGEVELELERALELQEEADASASGDYMIF
ncbi:hypothetical protein L6164_007580 [Bauhinia variegata]|uniref:Uncharacterized protein n=1 Tax=Bauhinia variegata TaxID=167791 RepID=A0ACB9PD32_BAUVA|nr:hypothetical protein L6164_007580 [Bauhinia variegata]